MMSLVKHKIERGIYIIDGVEVDIGLPTPEEPLTKGLNIFPGKDGTTELVCTVPTKEIVSEVIRKVDWNDISFIQIVFDVNNWIEVSGSHSDGYCSIYKKSKHRTPIS